MCILLCSLVTFVVSARAAVVAVVVVAVVVRTLAQMLISSFNLARAQSYMLQLNLS